MEVEIIVNLIKDGIPQAEVFLRDLTGGGNHFEAYVISDSFNGKSRLQRHQMVMSPLAELLKGPLHALTIKTYTQDDWARAQQNA